MSPPPADPADETVCRHADGFESVPPAPHESAVGRRQVAGGDAASSVGSMRVAAHGCIALRHLAQLVAVLLVHLLRLAGGLLRARLRVQLLLRADCGVQAGAGRRGRCWWPWRMRWRTQARSCRLTVLRGDEIRHSETREELTELYPCQRGAHGHLGRLPGQREGEGAGVGEQVDRLDVELGQLLQIFQKEGRGEGRGLVLAGAGAPAG